MQQSVLRGSQNKFYETRRAGKSLQSFLFFSFIQLLGYLVVVICFKKVLFHNANSHCIQVDFSLISSLNKYFPANFNEFASTFPITTFFIKPRNRIQSHHEMVFDENKNKDKYNFAHILSNVGLLPFMAMHYDNHLIPQGSQSSIAAFKRSLGYT